MKPVFRWTVGNCSDQGIEILFESVRRARELYEDTFKWYICYNHLKTPQFKAVSTFAAHFGVKLFKQDFLDCPIPQKEGSPRSNGEFNWDGSKVGGTTWKICPPRLDVHNHEIIMDNDIVFTDKIPEIDEFLRGRHCLILQDHFSFYGLFGNRVDRHIVRNKCERGPYNSGLIGLPPDFWFGEELSEEFYTVDGDNPGVKLRLTQADEQGLIVSTILQNPYVVIPNTTVVELLGVSPTPPRMNARGWSLQGKEPFSPHNGSMLRLFDSLLSPHRKAYHFTQANRLKEHFAWDFYKIMRDKGASILADFNNQEAYLIAKRAYLEGWGGSKDLAKNWSEDYTKRRLDLAKKQMS